MAIKDSFAEEAVNCLVAGRESEQYSISPHIIFCFFKYFNIMSSNITINESNKETFSSAEKLCLSDKKVALEIFYEPADKFLNNKGKEQFRRKCKECNNFKVGDLANSSHPPSE